MSRITARDNQSILDITIQEFGTMEQLLTLIVDNSLDANYKLMSGQELLINSVGVGDDTVKEFVITNNILYNNDQGEGNPPIEAGDFNNDYSNDYS